MNIELLEQIESTGVKAEKQALLKQLDAPTKNFVKLALDPDVTFGVTAPDDEACTRMWERANSGGNKGRGMNENAWNSWVTAQLNAFRIRAITGKVAESMVVEILQRAPTFLSAKWAGRVINRTLRAGFDISTFNKTFGAKTIEKFSVQLADTYEGEELIGEYLIQPKLDGNRVTLIDGLAMSRNGKEYPNCEHIIEEFSSTFWDYWVMDGEMMGNLGFDQSSGALRRLSQEGKKKAEFTYWAFDMVNRKEWEARNTVSLRERMQNLNNLFTTKFKNAKPVPGFILKNPTHEQLMKACEDYLKLGFEGAMVKDLDSPYVFKRGKNLLKVKKFFDADLVVKDFYEGKGKHKGRLGGIIVEGRIDGKIYCSKVGSGFDDAIRDEIWGNKKKWLNAIVQVQYQDATKDGSLRFPVFIMRRKDKE